MPPVEITMILGMDARNTTGVDRRIAGTGVDPSMPVLYVVQN
jgi:hypothetical protein